jgi:hypothetical protein
MPNHEQIQILTICSIIKIRAEHLNNSMTGSQVVLGLLGEHLSRRQYTKRACAYKKREVPAKDVGCRDIDATKK